MFNRFLSLFPFFVEDILLMTQYLLCCNHLIIDFQILSLNEVYLKIIY